MIEYEPAEERIVTRERIKIDGQVVGEIWPTRWGYPEQDGYQCQIKARPFGTTLNGIGATKEEAYRDAIKAGRDEAASLLQMANKLEAELAKVVA